MMMMLSYEHKQLNVRSPNDFVSSNQKIDLNNYWRAGVPDSS